MEARCKAAYWLIGGSGAAITLALLLLHPPASRADETGVSPSEPDAVVELEIATDGDLPVVTVESFGKKLRFLVDSTRAITTYDVRWEEELGESMRSLTVPTFQGRSNLTEFFRAPGLRIGPLQPALKEVGEISLQSIQDFVAARIDGLLGLDVLSQFVVTLDCDRGVLQLRPSLPADPGEQLPMDREGNGPPTVPVAIGGKRLLPVQICTDGPTALLLRGPRFGKLRENGAIWSTNPTLAPYEIERHCPNGILSEISIGAHVHRNIAVEACDVNGIGMQFLSRYVVTLDFPHGQAYFKPGKAFDRVDCLDQNGQRIVSRGNDIIIDQVAALSPGWESGILVGDLLRRVDETPVSAFSLFAMRRSFATERKSLAIEVERDGKVLSLQLAPRNYQDAWSRCATAVR